MAQIAARIGEPIIAPEDIQLAMAVLNEASEQIRHYAQQPYWTNETAPPVAVTIAVAAASRGYLNPAGFDQERGDMIMFNRNKDYVSGSNLTPQEITIIKALGRAGNVRSVGLASGDRPVPRSRMTPRDRGYCPVDWGGNKPFPLGYW
ncbi:MAG: hypothetical protein ACXVYB_00575 [Arthrobacter sp.]